MRTIKFRGKDKIDKKWIYGSYVYTNDDTNNPFRTESLKEKHSIVTYFAGDWNMGGWESVDIIPETLGQFTGLYDKNGKEIYEGDILAFDKSYTDFNDVIEVRFVRGVFAFLWNGNLEDECPINSPTHEWANVIGNIHDNDY